MKRLCQCIGPILLLVLVLASSGGCSKGARAKRLLKDAERDFNAKKYDDAEVEYKNVLRLNGLNPTAIGQLGRIFAEEGRIGEANTYLLKATELEPGSLSFQLALAEVQEAYRDTTNASKIALRILSAQPTNEDALLLFVRTSDAVQNLRQQVDSLPHIVENPGYHVALGLLALRQQKLVEAGSELHLALATDPKSSQAHFALAELHSLQKEEKETAQELQNAAAYAPLRSTIRIKYVDYLIRSGSTDEARKVLQEMTEKAPDYIPGWVSRMNLAMSERKYDEAAKFADTILARDERNYDAMLARGTVSLSMGDAGKAQVQFEHMESIFKKSPQVKYELALSYLLAKDKVKAVAYLNQALVLDPTYTQATLLLGQLEIRGGDAAAAVSLLTRFIKRSPSVGQAHRLLADAYLAEQKPESALAVYRNLAEAFPKSPQVRLLMGMILAGQRKITEARAAFETCLELQPDYLQAVEQLIDLDLAEHKYNDATALAEAQISRTPAAAEPWEILAKIDVAQRNLAHAETALLKAIELNPDLPSSYLLLAQVYVQGTNYEPALQKLNALVSRTNDAPAFLEIGAIHDELKHFEPASDAYEKVLKLNPHSIPALNNLAYIYAVRLHKIDRAFELAQTARELRPYDPNVEDTLGWVLFEKGDYSRALSLLEDGAEKVPADAEIQLHLGMTHYMMDEEDSARVALQRAVISKQDFANKDEAVKRLAVLNMDTTKAGPSGLAELEKALHDHPDDPVILNRIGTLQEQTGEAEKAAATYETALKQNPDAVHIMAKLARL
jgi:tetratricopeptide (TPR) repeat protein